eukprot:g27043.t1
MEEEGTSLGSLRSGLFAGRPASIPPEFFEDLAYQFSALKPPPGLERPTASQVHESKAHQACHVLTPRTADPQYVTLMGPRRSESPPHTLGISMEDARRVSSRESGTLLRASGYVIRLRPGGFMVALPDTAEVASFLQDLEAEGGGEPGVALHSVEVDMETVRGRFLGASPCLLADVVWDLSHHFGRATPLRAASVVELQKFAWGEQACRPRRASLEAAADNWIHDAMDEDTAADYVTGAEAELIAEEVPEAEPDTQEVIAAMQRRIEELEAREAVHMAQRPQTPATPTVPPGVLFSATPTVDTRHNTMARLRELAGAAPPRLGAHEKMARSSKPGHFAENLQQELTLEAVEPPELEEGLLELDKTITDPMQRMMLLQMQHLQLLTRQQQEKKTDPLQAALSGSETSGGGSGIKGCLAREAYVKLSADVSKTASAVQANAAQDLGLDPHQISSGMMKDYIEKRCPLGDQRLLIQPRRAFVTDFCEPSLSSPPMPLAAMLATFSELPDLPLFDRKDGAP